MWPCIAETQLKWKGNVIFFFGNERQIGVMSFTDAVVPIRDKPTTERRTQRFDQTKTMENRNAFLSSTPPPLFLDLRRTPFV